MSFAGWPGIGQSWSGAPPDQTRGEWRGWGGSGWELELITRMVNIGFWAAKHQTSLSADKTQEV